MIFQLVYKSKGSYLLNQLSPWNVDKLSPNQINDYVKQFRDCMDLIKVNIIIFLINNNSLSQYYIIWHDDYNVINNSPYSLAIMELHCFLVDIGFIHQMELHCILVDIGFIHQMLLVHTNPLQ